ncbi:MAG TPA: hypothetical protein EYN96_12570 [Candidatus Hydrogenedentes bacterium]|nr:hypothetical protein [Candidatus Hydrogenedentota bacterium]
MERDQNLLFGVFAVQLNKVTATQLMNAAAAWAVDPSKAIPGRLQDSRALTLHFIHRPIWNVTRPFLSGRCARS